MKEIKCLRCDGTLFKTVPLDEKGNRAVLSGTGLPLESEDGRYKAKLYMEILKQDSKSRDNIEDNFFAAQGGEEK